MWAERGGLDFDGRARWDAWAAKRGGRPERARVEFVRAFWETSPKAFYSDGRAALVKKA
jgi:acyl-CoA-binding protein